jgi:hypothetical protein
MAVTRLADPAGLGIECSTYAHIYRQTRDLSQATDVLLSVAESILDICRKNNQQTHRAF